MINRHSFSTKFRILLMVLTTLVVWVLSLVGGSWAGSVLAQGTVPTAPTATPPSPGPQPTSGPQPTATPSGFEECGSGPYTSNASGSDLFQTTDVGLGTARLFSNQGGIGPRRWLATIVSLTSVVIPPANLPDSPTGWNRLTCGLKVGAVDKDSDAIEYFRYGMQVCFQLPVGSEAFERLRLAYFSATLRRWVFPFTSVSANLACTSRFRLPATFVLFGRSF